MRDGLRGSRRSVRAQMISLEERRLFATVPTGFADAAYGGTIANGTAMEFAPDGRLFVLSQTGDVRIIQPNGTLNATTALHLTVDTAGERGLLGIAFDPTFDATTAGTDYVYLYYTVPSSATGTGAANNRVSRFAVNGDTIDPSSQTVLMNLDPLSGATNHNGGAIHFGADGKLYIAVGDNANGANAQSVTTRLGKILRINKDGTIPSDNPTTFQLRPTTSTTYTTGTPVGDYRSIWAVGLRNPYTFAVEPGTGKIHINDVGENTWEEINVGAAGRNYGWPRVEGDFSNATTGNENFTRPLYTYQHGSGTSLGFAISGGAFYSNSTAPLQFPQAYQNSYFFGDYVNDWIDNINPAAPPAISSAPQFASNTNGIVDLKLGADGALYELQREGSTGGVLSGVRRIGVNTSLAPTITTQPTSRTVDQGRSTTFSVAATSPTSALSYQWTRNGVDIAGATASSYTLASAALSDDNAVYRVRVMNAFATALSNGATLDVLADTTAPTVVSQTFDRDNVQHRITSTLSESIQTSFGVSSATLINSITGGAVSLATVSYVDATKSLVVQPSSRLADGRYRLTLTGLKDLAGNALPTSVFNFTFMIGDANASGTVDFADLVTLAQNYNQSGRTFSQGDFDYSGTVDFADLVLLAQRYNQTLPSIRATPSSVLTTPTKKRRVE